MFMLMKSLASYFEKEWQNLYATCHYLTYYHEQTHSVFSISVAKNYRQVSNIKHTLVGK